GRRVLLPDFGIRGVPEGGARGAGQRPSRGDDAGVGASRADWRRRGCDREGTDGGRGGGGGARLRRGRTLRGDVATGDRRRVSLLTRGMGFRDRTALRARMGPAAPVG